VVYGVSCCVRLLKKSRFSRHQTGVKKCRQNACYVSLWIWGFRRSGFSSPTCTHSTPHTNFYSSCNSTSRIITVFLDHCLLFLGVRTSPDMKSSVIYGHFVSVIRPVKIPFPKIQTRLSLREVVFVNDTKSSVCCIFWRWRIHTPVCCGSRVRHCFWVFQHRFLPPLFSVK